MTGHPPAVQCGAERWFLGKPAVRRSLQRGEGSTSPPEMIKRLIIVARPARRPGPSLTEIAAALGVSAATVSNALSRKGRVSSDVAEKIRRRAAALGYVPSPAARALRTGRTGVLGLVLPDIANPLFPQIAQAIEAAASGVGRGVLIADSRGSVLGTDRGDRASARARRRRHDHRAATRHARRRRGLPARGDRHAVDARQHGVGRSLGWRSSDRATSGGARAQEDPADRH